MRLITFLPVVTILPQALSRFCHIQKKKKPVPKRNGHDLAERFSHPNDKKRCWAHTSLPPRLRKQLVFSPTRPYLLPHKQPIRDRKADESGGNERGRLRPNEQQTLREWQGGRNSAGRLLHRDDP